MPAARPDLCLDRPRAERIPACAPYADASCRGFDLGKLGQSVEWVKALKLTRAYVEARPPAENVMVAIGILGAALNGAREEPVGETVAANPEAVSA